MRRSQIGLLVLGACNKRSVTAALERADARTLDILQREDLERVDAVIFPGVANVGYVARALDHGGLRTPLGDAIRGGLPLLGICAGFQMLFEHSDEDRDVTGLGVFRGNVEALRGPKRLHMGWNRVAPLTANMPEGWAYFAHGFAAPANADGVIATTRFGSSTFASVSRGGSVTGVQFHPERSGAYGQAFLQQFVDAARGAYAG